MAARRLLILMVILLTISTVAAALVPPPQERSTSTGTSTATTAPAPPADSPGGAGKLVRKQISVRGTGDAKPVVEVQAGDQLALVVASDAPGELSIPAFGLVEFAAPGDPARFDLLLEKEGHFPIRLQGRGTVAEIVAER